MFYRFLSKLATQERLEAFPVPRPGSDARERWGVGLIHYEKKFTPAPDIFQQPGVKFFQAPLLSDRPVMTCLRFHQGKEVEPIPDLWGVGGYLFISERAKSVIKNIDTMEHEYFPVQLLNHKEEPIASEQAYYWFNERRFLTITPSNRVATAAELGFYPIPKEEDFMARVKDSPTLREQLGQIPLWRHCIADIDQRHLKARTVLYLNETLVEAFRVEGIKGLDLYSEKYGITEESLCSI
ncbi:hypothetical protein HCH_00615 [Hahella chejuensis KCTC 2396]|uniref:Immunity MXAN-0049 protein domain-containing protein n=1 Tax=Hahella chejuensis (strain KCTC 2396) TaxID=349521 RepID=Q2SPA7_HAHCH|nr:DUF1629 domain-containing protein [Hahella chejuensis]ABC27517.1 hypothetical protein HCH_00615 [Hahella chejuensis KCTC 2396]